MAHWIVIKNDKFELRIKLLNNKSNLTKFNHYSKDY